MPRTMTLGELKEAIEELERMEGEQVLDKPVYGVSNYGDHCHTQQLVSLGDPSVIRPHATAYSDTGLCVYKDGDPDQEEVVVLMD